MRKVIVAAVVVAFALPAVATMKGTVVGIDGAPIANAKVVASDPPLPGNEVRRRAAIAEAQTDAKGAFALDVPGKGVVDLSVTRDGYAPADLITAIDDAPGAIVLAKAPAIVIHVNSIDGSPIADADVIAYGGSGGVLAMKTDAAGTCRMPDPSVWAVNFVIRKAGFEPFSYSPSDWKSETFKLKPSTSSVKGRVVGEHDEAVAGAQVELDGMTATTSADGSFAIEGATTFWNVIRARSGDQIGVANRGAQPLVIHLSPLMHLRGVVRDAQTIPLRGIVLSAGWTLGVTDANGAFDLEVPRARYDVALSKSPSVYARASQSYDPMNKEDAPREIVATKLVAVDGKVVRDDGAPVPLAQIMTTGMFNSNTGIWSSPAGAFRVYVDPKNTTALSVSKRGLPGASTSIAKLPVKIVVGTPVTLTGTVRDRAGKPIADVTISAGGASSRTKADGTWSVMVSRGPMKIIVYGNNPYGRAEREINVAASMPPIDFVLTKLGTIEGHVVDAEGKPKAGVHVAIGDQKTFTDAEGEFTFYPVEEGETPIRFGPYLSQEQKATAPDSNVKLTLTRERKLRGKVIDHATHAPITKFKLEYGDHTKLVESAAGAFDIDIDRNAPLSVSAPGYSARRNRLIQEGDEDDFVILLTKGRLMRGRVVDEHGKPVAGVMVTTDDEYPPERPIETNAEGRYEILATGPHVGFAKRGFVSITYQPDGIDDPHTLDVTLKHGITVTGTVVDKSGSVVAGADVTASSAATFGGPWNALTDDAGNFRIEDLAPARYDFRAAQSEQSERGTVRDVEIEKTPHVKIVVEKAETATIVGHVNAGSMGDAPIWVNVIASPEDSQHVQADSGGNFRITNAPAGMVEVEALSIKGERTATSRRVAVEAKPGAEVRVDLSLVQEAHVHGVVHWNKVEIPGMIVTFDGAFAVTKNDGSYELTVQPGEYDVTIAIREDQQLPFSQHVNVSGDAEMNFQVDTVHLPVKVIDADTKKPLSHAGVAILARDTKHAELMGGTSDNGEIDMPAAPGRPITVHAWMPDYANVFEDVTPDAKPSMLTLELKRSAGTVVRVVDARDGSTIFGSIVVRDMSGRYAATANKFKADEGTVTIALLPGKYQFSASAENYGSATIVAEVPAPSEVRIPLPRGGRLLLRSSIELKGTARLFLPNGQPYVRCWCNGISDIAITGRATLVDLVAPGAYTLEVTPANGKPRRFPVTVIEGQTVSVSLD